MYHGIKTINFNKLDEREPSPGERLPEDLYSNICMAIIRAYENGAEGLPRTGSEILAHNLGQLVADHQDDIIRQLTDTGLSDL